MAYINFSNQLDSMEIINILQVVVSVLLIASILMQNRGSGLSSAFGGDFGGYYTKRGFEKFLLYFSIFLSVFFIALSIGNVVLNK